MVREAAVPSKRLGPTMSIQERNRHTIQTCRLGIAVPRAGGKRKPLNAQASEQSKDEVLDNNFRRSPRGREVVVEITRNDQQIGRRGLKAQEDMEDCRLVRWRQIEIPKTDSVGAATCNDFESAPGKEGTRGDTLPTTWEKSSNATGG